MSKQYKVVDLFAGAGGLSLGFTQAGFDVIGAVEIDKWASSTYAHNFKDHTVYTEDLIAVKDSFYKQFKDVDVVVGGPPCQGFSIAASNRRDSNDSRNTLYNEYLRATRLIKPKVILVENVKEIMNARLKDGTSLLDDFVKKLELQGFTVNYTLLNAKYYGVPQDRIRFFMVGTRKGKFDFKKVAKKNRILSVEDAISDLPKFKDGEFVPEDSFLKFEGNPLTDYQRRIRNGAKGVYNHVPMRHTPRIIERFKHIPIGGDMENVPEAHSARARGNVDALSGKKYYQNHRRLNPTKPSRTITASFYSSFIHPYQNRNLTAREAARIQGFPDSFVFLGKRTTLSKKLLARKGVYEDLFLDQFNQVGNSVPPPLAKELATVIKNYV